jgi:hypothetical protein
LEPFDPVEVAALLHEAVESDWWALTALRGDQLWRESVAARAVGLYRRSWPLIARSQALHCDDDVSLGTDHRLIDLALALIGDVADVYAFMAEDWGSNEPPPGLAVMPKLGFDWLIRENGLDVWAAGLGYPLELPEEIEDFDLPVADESVSREEQATRVASDFVQLARHYDNVMALRVVYANPDVARVFGGDPRNASARRIAVTVAWSGWVAQHLDGEAQPLAVAALWMARAEFVISWESGSEEEVFPSIEQLREFLRRTEADVLTEEHGGNLDAAFR